VAGLFWVRMKTFGRHEHSGASEVEVCVEYLSMRCFNKLSAPFTQLKSHLRPSHVRYVQNR
jgi:hypothetical protein